MIIIIISVIEILNIGKRREEGSSSSSSGGNGSNHGSGGIDSAPIYMSLMKSPFLRADQDPVLQVVNKGLLRDLMCDVRSLLRCQTAILQKMTPTKNGSKNSMESSGSVDIEEV